MIHRHDHIKKWKNLTELWGLYILDFHCLRFDGDVQSNVNLSTTHIITDANKESIVSTAFAVSYWLTLLIYAIKDRLQ